MAGAEVVTHAWKEWGLQALVLLSFMLQLELLVLAELRRRIDSNILRAFAWAAYQLADATAIYVLGHLAVTSRSLEHELMAFWAPFLLLHLGGQDNITAYAIEDNGLWLRHLQTLVVQVAAAAYVLYESSIIGSQPLLRLATITMFAVGVVKYGERVCALWIAGSSPGNNYRSFGRSIGYPLGTSTSRRDMEGYLLIAHLLLDVPKDFLKGPLPHVVVYFGTSRLRPDETYKVVEMQLCLMHDVFYTKAEVMHTWYGLWIRAISPLAATVALFLFHRLGDQKDRYGRADVAITYVLLIGAVVLETMSSSRAMFSSWTCTLLLNKWGRNAQGDEQRNMWDFFGRVLGSLRRLVRAADRRKYWTGSMGQHNLLQVCAHCRASLSSKLARWIGLEDPWNTLAYTGPATPVSAVVEYLVLEQVLKGKRPLENWSPYQTLNSTSGVWASLKNKGLYTSLGMSVDPQNFGLEESILVWHIATDVYLCWYKQQEQAKTSDCQRSWRQQLSEAVEVLSNYMLFLLATRPYMLPPHVGRNAYVELCYGLTALKYNSAKDMAILLGRYGDALISGTQFDEFAFTAGLEERGESLRHNETLQRGSQLAAKLIGQELQDSPTSDVLELIAHVWAEMLCDVGNRCSAYSHVKQLSNGGELITVAALLAEYHRREILKAVGG